MRRARVDVQAPVVVVTVPIRTVSESNAREHWSKKAKRVGKQRDDVCMCWRAAMNARGRTAEERAPWLAWRDNGGVVVRLVRVAPRALDDDNLCGGALKAVRDQVAVELPIAKEFSPAPA